MSTAPGSPHQNGGSPDPEAAARWAALESLLLAALEQEPGDRARFLEEACPDTGERRDVEALLEAHERPGMLDALDGAMEPLREAGEAAPAVARTPATQALPPEVDLERYTLLDRLGGGGMGVVYRARDRRLDRDVALKFLPPHLSTDEAAKKRFMVEARAAASLEHPNICTVHEIGETADGQLYIVMGCYDGDTLDKRIAHGELAVEEALRIAADVARGLAKAHDRGIVHRDVKPANIMLTSDGLVKILDFGIAKLSHVTVNQTVGIIGTLAYMSPEQAFGETVDARSDVWALGIVLHEMLTGSRPFRGPGEQAVLYAILTAELEPVEHLRPGVPAEVDAVLRRALAKKPEERFADAREMLAALLAAMKKARHTPPGGAPLRPRRDATPVAHAEPPADSLLTNAGERRHAAVLVTGIAGYTGLVERLAPAELDRLVAAVRDAATDAATRHGGIVNHFAADEAVLLFGVGTSHEDDYLRAVRAALQLHGRSQAIAAAAGGGGRVELHLRSGIHVGSLVAQRLRSGDRRFRITGAPLDVASRLAALAGPDAVLVSPETYRLVAPFVDAEAAAPVRLQSEMDAVTPHRITGESNVHTRLEVAERVGLTPFAGRGRELTALEEQLEASLRGEGALAVVIGEPGTGKSRLVHELRRRAGETPAKVVLGRCDAYGGTTPYTPFVQVLRQLLWPGDGAQCETDAEAVAERVRAIDASLEESIPLVCTLLALPSAAYPLPRHLQGEHLQAAMLEALAALVTLQASREPTVMLLEDWHWADEASRHALEQLVEVAPAHPLLLVVTCRPEAGLDWSSGDRRAIIHLGPMSLESAQEIMCGVLGAARIAPELAHQLHERTGGNPFFLEETCQALREQGAMAVRGDEAWAEDPNALTELPETVQAVIRTRLDRLRPEVRDTLRIASVIGREFTRGVLEELAGAALEPGRQLDQLRRTGLVQQTTVAPEPVYRFKHVLTQEVAYDTLLEHQRQTLHARVARIIERRYAERLEEHRERLALHYSRAEEWAAAVQHGIAAADRAKAISQFADALAMLDRTRDWVGRLPDQADRHEMLADVLLRQERLCETMGLRTRQIAIIEELIALLAPHGGSARLAEAYLRQGDVFILLRRYGPADRALGTSLRLSRELGDRAGERNVLRSLGLLRSHEEDFAAAIGAIEAALHIDFELSETLSAAGDVASLGNVLRKMGRHEDALHAVEQALAYPGVEDDPTKQCALMSVVGSIYRDLGDNEAALTHLVRARDAAIRQRLPIMASFSLPAIAAIQLQQGAVEDALATYREAVDICRRARYAEGLAQAQRVLGEVLFGLERFAEAIPHLAEAAGLAEELEKHDALPLLGQRLATAHERGGDAASAERYWERVRERCEMAADLGGEGDALEGIARCARRRGVRATAIGHYERALGRAVSAGNAEREMSLRNTLGLLRWEDGAYAEALRQYEAALRLCRELEDRVHEGLILNSLGATLLKLRRYDEARTALEEGAQTNALTGQRQLEAHSHAVLGDVLLESGHPEAAVAAFERSLAIRPEIGDRRGEGWMLERLARALRASGRGGDGAVALEAARVIAHDMQDDVLTAALDRQQMFESQPTPHQR